MTWIDTHTHLDFSEFDPDRLAVIERARAAGIEKMIVVGVFQEQWHRLNALRSDFIATAIGIHPCWINEKSYTDIHTMAELLESDTKKQWCAIGECGLDFYQPQTNREAQWDILKHQIQLAVHFDKPLLLHVRRAHQDMIALLKQGNPRRGGIVHAFSGSIEEAKSYHKLGFYLGLGGAASWPQALRLKRTLQQLPLNFWVMETDAPDMIPYGFPDKRHEPAYMPMMAKRLAEELGLDVNALAQITTQNAKQLFDW